MDTHDELHRSIRLLEQGILSFHDFLEKMLEYLAHFPEQQDGVLVCLGEHPNASVQAVVPTIREILRKRKESEQAKDINRLRKTSPLQPGVRLTVGGGYTAIYEPPRWLNGRECYDATFLGFMLGNSAYRPVALVELDEEVISGQSKGRYALLRLLYEGTWEASQTVVVHIVEAPPDDIDAFYAADPFPYYKAAETHATYGIAAPAEGKTS